MPHEITTQTTAQAPTVREAARCLIRFEALYGSNYRGQSSFHEDAQGAWLRFYSISPYNAYNRFVVDSIIAGWLHQLSSISPAPLRAERIYYITSRPNTAARSRWTWSLSVAWNRKRIESSGHPT